MATPTVAKKPINYTNLVDHYRQYNSSDIIIRPYIDPTVPNMGLEKYGQVLFEGAMHDQPLRCTEYNGVKKYWTGLDENARSVKDLPEAERKAKVKMIRETVVRVEKEMYGNNLDVNDEDFWSKTVFAPNNDKYWGTVRFALGNDGRTLDPNDPHELLIIIAAQAGGFDDIAGSYEEAKEGSTHPKFYLEKRRDSRIEEGKLKELKDHATYELYKIRMEEPQRLFILAKNILPIANSYKKTDSPLLWYGDLSDFIIGAGIEKDKKKAPVRFLDMIAKGLEYLTIRAYVLEAAFLKKIVTKSDNKIYNWATGSLLGANLEEVVEHLRQPTSQVELDSIQEQIDGIWSR